MKQALKVVVITENRRYFIELDRVSGAPGASVCIIRMRGDFHSTAPANREFNPGQFSETAAADMIFCKVETGLAGSAPAGIQPAGHGPGQHLEFKTCFHEGVIYTKKK